MVYKRSIRKGEGVPEGREQTIIRGIYHTQVRVSLRPRQGTTSQAPSAWNATLGMRASCPAPASSARTLHGPSAAAPRVPAGEKPVTSAQLRTQVRPSRVPILSGSAFQGATERGGRGGQSPALSELRCLLTVEFSEICPSGKGYIPVEGAWTFGQTMYTGNLPTDPDPQTPLT